MKPQVCFGNVCKDADAWNSQNVFATDCHIRTKSRKEDMWMVIGMIFISVLSVSVTFALSRLDTHVDQMEILAVQQDTTLLYRLNNGTMLEIDINPNESADTTEIIYTLGTTETYGHYNYTTGKDLLTDAYPFFWFFVPNILFGDSGSVLEVGNVINISIPCAIFSKIGNYSIVIGERTTYFPTSKKMLGSQLSVTSIIYDDENKTVASALYDGTSGLLEIIDGFLEIEDPGEINTSRHRIAAMYLGLVLSAVFVVVIAGWVIYSKSKRYDIILLAGVGSVVFLADFLIDIWFNTYMGDLWLCMIHLGLILVFIPLIYAWKIHKGWLLPSVLELLFPIFLWLATGVPMYEVFIFPLGLLVTYVGILFTRKMPTDTYECV